MGHRGLVGIALSLLLGACTGDGECERHDDCASPLRCFDNRCQRIGGGGGGRPDPIPDAGTAPDAGDLPRPDGGPQDPDGGPQDPDGGPRDPDGGPIEERDGGPVAAGAAGLIWLSDVRIDLDSEVEAFAELRSWAGADVDFREELFPDEEGGHCVLRTRRLRAGQPAPFSAERIDIQPTARAATHFSMQHVGDGRFAPQGPVPAYEPFVTPGTSRASIVAGQGPGSLGGATFEVATPAIIDKMNPEPGDRIWIGGGMRLFWHTGATNRDVVIEAYDQPREVVLTCVVRNDGEYRLTLAAAAAFVAAARTGPSVLEMRHDVEQTQEVAVEGQGTIPVTFRVSWTNRFRVQD